MGRYFLDFISHLLFKNPVGSKHNEIEIGFQQRCGRNQVFYRQIIHIIDLDRRLQVPELIGEIPDIGFCEFLKCDAGIFHVIVYL